jgi:target of rapamycin complex subunit LST8
VVKGNVYVWKMSTARNVTIVTPTTKFKAHNKYLTRCCLSSDVKLLATASADTTVKIWSTDDDQFSLVMTLEGHQRWVWDCAFSADSAYVVSGIQPITPLSILCPLVAFSFVAAVLTLAASSDHIVRLWELSQRKTIRQYSGHHKGVVALALNDTLLLDNY